MKASEWTLPHTQAATLASWVTVTSDWCLGAASPVQAQIWALCGDAVRCAVEEAGPPCALGWAAHVRAPCRADPES
jgi:hypothetical protein